MRVVIQRAKNAKCTIDGQITGQIDYGYCIFVGFNNEDTNEIIDKMIHKILFLRIFEDENGKMNKSIQDVEVFFLFLNLPYMRIVKRGIAQVLQMQVSQI